MSFIQAHDDIMLLENNTTRGTLQDQNLLNLVTVINSACCACFGGLVSKLLTSRILTNARETSDAVEQAVCQPGATLLVMNKHLLILSHAICVLQRLDACSIPARPARLMV